MRCVNCGEEIPDDSRFCVSCGRPAPALHPTMDSGMACGVCGAPLTYGDNFCCACGTPVLWDDADEDDPAAASPVRWDMPEGETYGYEETEDGPEEEDAAGEDFSAAGFTASAGREREPVPVYSSVRTSAVRGGKPAASSLKGSLADGGRVKGRPEDYGKNDLFDRAGDL